jgi:hypothetical protein
MLQRNFDKYEGYGNFTVYMKHKFKVLDIKENIIMLSGFLILLFAFLSDSKTLKCFLLLTSSSIYAYVVFLFLLRYKMRRAYRRFLSRAIVWNKPDFHKMWLRYLNSRYRWVKNNTKQIPFYKPRWWSLMSPFTGWVLYFLPYIFIGAIPFLLKTFEITNYELKKALPRMAGLAISGVIYTFMNLGSYNNEAGWDDIEYF